MTERRFTRFLRGIVSLAATLALLVGVPLLLAMWVGWPLPESIPGIASIENAARSGISDQVVVNTLAVVAWLAWAQLALSLIVEIVAVARGHQATRLPVLPGFQVTAARLVTGILAMVSTLQPVAATAAPQPPLPVVAHATVPSPASLGPTTTPDLNGHSIDLASFETAAPDPSAADHPTVTVQRHDSYWAIAERTLGDGLRWREILDLNAGRTLPDGTTIIAGDDTLHTGWVLLLPTDARPDPTTEPAASTAVDPGPAPAVAGPSSVVVEAGDSLWTISEDRLGSDLGRAASDAEVALYWRQVVDANHDRYVDPANPSLILPGQTIDLPPTGHEPPPPPADAEAAPPPAEIIPDPPTQQEAEEPAPDAPEPSTTTTVPHVEAETPTTSPPAATDSTTAAATDDQGPIGSLPAMIAIGGLSSIAIAVGAKRLIAKRRRRFADEHDGELPGRTPPDQYDLHQAIVAQADEERIDDLQEILGHLATTLARAGSARRPRMIRHATDSLEVLLDQPDTHPPAGWTASGDGTIWTLTDAPEADDLYDGPLSPAPLMVTIGQPEDNAQLYLDLETDGLTALTGDPTSASDLARSILTELTLSPLADTLRVIAIGEVIDNSADALEHLTLVDSWETIADDLGAWATQSHDALAEHEWPNAFIGRGNDPDHDALVPVAVVADRPPPPELAALLRTNQPSTVAAVVIGDFEGAVATLRCEPDTLNFDHIDLACSPQALDAAELADLARVFVAPDSPDEQLVMDELLAEYEALGSDDGAVATATEMNGHEPSATGDEPPMFDVLVRLLGDITIDGKRPLKPKATAVVSYIALHRSVTTERLEEACWFGSDGTSHIKRLHDTMTEARAAIGSQHLPANRSGAYEAGSGLRTDLDVFDWHIERASQLDAPEAVDHYRAALDLVHGKPFTYPNAARNSYGWVDFEHHATTWEHRVSSIAQACSALYLDLDQPSEAIAMLRHIVQAIPLNGSVVESLMRAHLANHDRQGAEQVYREHATALVQAKLGDPADSIEQLRLELLSR